MDLRTHTDGGVPLSFGGNEVKIRSLLLRPMGAGIGNDNTQDRTLGEVWLSLGHPYSSVPNSRVQPSAGRPSIEISRSISAKPNLFDGNRSGWALLAKGGWGPETMIF